MIYQTASAFRRALETRLAADSTKTDTPLVRLRKLVAFDRFLARLALSHPNGWLLKGGLALQLRIGEYARTTQDVDVLLTLQQPALRTTLRQAVQMDLGDWFTLELRSTAAVLPGVGAESSHRFFMRSLVDRRTFENFHVDVGVGDPVLQPAEYLMTPPILAFAGIPPISIPCYPVSQHLAEKVHAYVTPREQGENTRVKDLIDMVLFAVHTPISAEALSAALNATFEAHGSAAPPRSLPTPPAAWGAKYQRLAESIDLDVATLPAALDHARRLLDPILDGTARGTWSPVAQAWTISPNP